MPCACAWRCTGSGWGRASGLRNALRSGSFSLGSRRRAGAAGRSGLLGTAAGEDLGLKDLPDRSDVAEVLSGGANFDGPGDEGEPLLILMLSHCESVLTVQCISFNEE